MNTLFSHNHALFPLNGSFLTFTKVKNQCVFYFILKNQCVYVNEIIKSVKDILRAKENKQSRKKRENPKKHQNKVIKHLLLILQFS